MTIYISHSTKFDFINELYRPVQEATFFKEHTFLFPHEQSTDTLFSIREHLHEKKVGLVLAEVSYPSTGQGIELGWASLYEVPIICLYKQGVTPSNSLSMVSSKLLMYTDQENMIADITGVLASYT